MKAVNVMRVVRAQRLLLQEQPVLCQENTVCASIKSLKSVVIYSLIKRLLTQTVSDTYFFTIHLIIFNSEHISVSRDALHCHEILRRTLEGKISSLLSQKDQKSEDTAAPIQGIFVP